MANDAVQGMGLDVLGLDLDDLDLNAEVLGMEEELDEQLEVTELCLPELEADDDTEIIELDPCDVRPNSTFRIPFMSGLFRNL